MRLSLHEIDKLLLHNAGVLAQKRLAQGMRLNIPESIALLAFQVLQFIRSGNYSVAKLMEVGRSLLGHRQVLPGVAEVLVEVQVEGTFPDGTKLVTLHNPICQENGNLALALDGSFLPVPSLSSNDTKPHPEEGLNPGCIHSQPGSIKINVGRNMIQLKVMNCSDRPIQVGSHYHFIETNPSLCFNRHLSFGKRLNIASGTAVRFEPGEMKTVSLVEIGGRQLISGGNGLCEGKIVSDGLEKSVIADMVKKGFFDSIFSEKSVHLLPELQNQDEHDRDKKRRKTVDHTAMHKIRQEIQSADNLESCVVVDDTNAFVIPRDLYSRMYGPTTGDIVRLADSELYIQVEDDKTVYGDECVFGGGKVLREGMGQATGLLAKDQLDCVITNALIVDFTGIYKADIGIKNGFITGIGKAGNPDVMDGVTEGMVVGVNTEVIAGEGLIVTAGAVDSHIHFICPQICQQAVSAGITTLLGGGTGPASGTCATTCTPSPDSMHMMLKATDELPLNFAFTGKGNTSKPEGLIDIIEAGAVGLKLHEDWGTTPSAIRNCLTVADQEDVQVTIHTDTLNESCCVEGTLEAIAGRAIHTYHSEGAGGGHAPDIITVCSQPNVIPSSTNPTRPLTVNTIDEHLDMLMVCHHLDKSIPEDVAFAESRIRMETIAAEDLLHDMGAISIISSDSQAMGRVGEVITRTWQTADKMKRQRGSLKEDLDTMAFHTKQQRYAPVYPTQCHDASKLKQPIQIDNFRVRRYVAKYTINPCLAHGFAHITGSVEKNKMADLVLWKPAYFGVKPEMVIKGGYIAWSQMGDANASIPTPEPVIMRPMYGSLGKAASKSSYVFVSQRCVTSGVGASYGLSKTLCPVQGTRNVGKKDMKLNDATPVITVDPETYRVEADGVHLTCEQSHSLPMSQRYFLF